MKPRKKNSFDIYDDELDEEISSQNSKNDNPPMQRNAANARERARMRVLSSAFGRLKTKLPNIPPDTKLSKLDTLRLATMYIKQLKTLIESPSNQENIDSIEQTEFFGAQHSPQNMSWPFGLYHTQSVNRQLAAQYSTMDWNEHTQDAYPRMPRISNDSYHQHRNSDTNHWCVGTPTSEINNSSICVYNSPILHYQNRNYQLEIQNSLSLHQA